jgi:glycosyltransferase involved in cell wall biosynthesis
VIADSQSTRADLIELLGIAAARIDVVPLGLGAVRRLEPEPEPALRARFALGERRVVLSLSAKRPHKNLRALIGALALIPVPERPMLVLPGYPTAHEAELRAHTRALGLEADVRLLGWLAQGEIEGLWQLAEAFVFPSLYEGFGLPVLEAMARGVPVACSNASSLPELAGDAALLFDPHDEAQIAGAVRRLLREPELAERLRARGRERVRQFTWEHAARATIESYRRALAAPRRMRRRAAREDR